MGASVSTNKSDVMNKIVNKAYNSCASDYRNNNGISASNEVNLQGVKHIPPEWCKDVCTSHPITGNEVCGANFEVNQAAKVEADCVIDQMQTSINDVMSQMSAEAKAGILGVAASTNISNVKNEIENIVDNSCESVSANNQQTYKDIEVRACNFYALQNLDAKKSCKIGSTQGVANTVATSMEAKAEGVNLADLFGGLLMWLILIPVGLVIIFVIYKVIKSSGEDHNLMPLNSFGTSTVTNGFPPSYQDAVSTAASSIGLPTDMHSTYTGSTINIANAPEFEKCKHSGQSMVGALTQMLVKDGNHFNTANKNATSYVMQNLDRICMEQPTAWADPMTIYGRYKTETTYHGGSGYQFSSQSMNMFLIIGLALFIFFLVCRNPSRKKDKKIVLEKPSVYSKRKKY